MNQELLHLAVDYVPLDLRITHDLDLNYTLATLCDVSYIKCISSSSGVLSNYGSDGIRKKKNFVQLLQKLDEPKRS